jgi:hypothetical protein
MGKRKTLAQRKPGGRIYTYAEPQLPPPSEIRRLRDLVHAGVRPAEYGSELGRLNSTGKISETQYAAGRKWAALVEQYASACCGPKPPCSLQLDRAGGSSVDVDSDAGLRIVKRDSRATESFLAARTALGQAGEAASTMVRAVTEKEQACTTIADLENLRRGLNYLTAHWEISRRKKI